MPDRFTAQRLIEAYTVTVPIPEVYEMGYDERQKLYPMVADRYTIVDTNLSDARFIADLEALVEFAIEQALAGKLESL